MLFKNSHSTVAVPREGAGVTPGLRRRRERAERQKSFMREQQDAVASGYRFGSVADESEHGKRASKLDDDGS